MTLQIGSILLDSPVLLAPMAGVTDMPFRRIARRWGAGLTFSEMIASEAMIRSCRQTLRMTQRAPEDVPAAVQIAGCEPEVMAQAARLNEALGADIIDINMGCPVKKVVKGDAGSALMRDEKLAGAILEAVVKAVGVPVTLKMRTGWDESSRNAPRLARIAEEAGIAMVTVHGRTRCQLYSGHADWDFIGEVKRVVSIPVIGNGDVASFDDARELLDRSGADGVMIGRAACGRPWLPGRIARFLATGERQSDPDLSERYTLLCEHFEAMIEHYGELTGCRMARKHMAWYSKGLPGSAEFRESVNRSVDARTVRELTRAYFEPLVERMAA